MNRKPIFVVPEYFPPEVLPWLNGAKAYDSSCSPEARVIFLDKDQGVYLKSASKGSLAREATMTEFFHQKGMAAEVLLYLSGEKDWLLTERVPGEDCTHALYLSEPKRLCDTLAELLREIHETDSQGCPVPDRMREYFTTAEQNHAVGRYDATLFDDNPWYASADEAWRIVCEGRSLLQSDTLLHGDYCLPNVMLDQWHFSGLIDVGNGGIGDRHVDLFWGIWTLRFNLGTDCYRDRFFDAYGREAVEEDRLRIIAAAEAFG